MESRSNTNRQRQALLALSLTLFGNSVSAFQNPNVISPTRTRLVASTPLTKSFITVDKQEVEKTTAKTTTLVDPSNLQIDGVQEPTALDLASYESSLLGAWDDDTTLQKGFDWEIEKLRRYHAGLRQREDGKWERKPSLFDFLVTNTPKKVVGDDSYESPPKPVHMLDVGVLVVKNMLNGLGFGPSLGMAAVPDAVIQKYEGSFFTFIKGVLGGDLQTLAGGPLFLLLAKYYQDYGSIFTLSFGPKSFLVISDPVMAKHILKDSSPEQYCKGMLAEILEPIMGDGLIPADPKIWKVRRDCLLRLM